MLNILIKSKFNINLKISKFLIFYFIISFSSWANGIEVSNIFLKGFNADENFTLVNFDLSWENSWRYSNESGINNWDAAWVFIKFRTGSSNPTFVNIRLTDESSIVTLPTTSNLRVGMPVRVIQGASSIPLGTVIKSIDSDTQITLTSKVDTDILFPDTTLEFLRIWEHAYLSPSGHNVGTGMISDVGLLNPYQPWNADTNPGLGLFIYRASPGEGEINLKNLAISWNYRDNNLDPNSIIEVQVFSIEMVYIPQGSFYLGDGLNANGRFTQANSISGNTVPFRVTSSRPTLQGNDISSSSTNLSARLGSNDAFDLEGTQIANLTSNFPTGFKGFYCMKYEISQGQYRDFLNSLTGKQQENCININYDKNRDNPINVGSYVGGKYWRNGRIETSYGSNFPENRIGLRYVENNDGFNKLYACDLNPSTSLPDGTNEIDDGESLAMGLIAWSSGAAYLDWSGLRPMTELEFEKACRGPIEFVESEFAWGEDAESIQIINGLVDAGKPTEVPSSSSTNANLLAKIIGPVRVGSFVNSNSNRVDSGSSFWGIMNLSDNNWDRIVSIGNIAGRSFTGMHGNGQLLADGRADVDFWPGINGNDNSNTSSGVFLGNTGVTGVAGTGFRGGTWPLQTIVPAEVSNRAAADNPFADEMSFYGLRGVRSAGCFNSSSAPEFNFSDGLSPSIVPMGSIREYGVNSSGQFLWIFPKGWKIISGQGTNRVKVYRSDAGLDGSVRVSAINECGGGEEAVIIVASPGGRLSFNENGNISILKSTTFNSLYTYPKDPFYSTNLLLGQTI
ncbi:SUMF1/EgtB/PvdO family nonheme iron enzyme [uncultured Algoriphagus sp.]|uniref:SUMF1/EgtB/PvdO family nonheme iron enzyme n=1 Tax=uncultured Algoriphagus sp. TaxID=417365 RepID=UPI00259617F4|nr:SUMF1/EgtB/PvdO family nonheme iron enzyme [uncultured Algoriphagus sp.]